MLETNRDILGRSAAALLEKETLDEMGLREPTRELRPETAARAAE